MSSRFSRPVVISVSRRSFPRELLAVAILWLGLVGSHPAQAARPEIQLQLVRDGLSNIVDIGAADSGHLFLVGQDGVVWRIAENGDDLAQYVDLSTLVGSGFEQGALSIAAHPDYAVNGFVYVYLTDLDDEAILMRFERDALDPTIADISTGVTLMTFDQDGHYGGDLSFGPDGFLYFGIGDGGQQQDPFCRAQTMSLYQGKMLRIDVDQNVATPPYYGVPATNPFVGTPGTPDEIWAAGFRNPWRMGFDRVSGDLFIADVGQVAREEVSLQPAASTGGENYGWKVMEGTSCFDPDPIDIDCPMSTASCFDSSYTDPILEYDHSQGDCSITGGFVYRGSTFPDLFGEYFYGDWCTGNLWVATGSGMSWTSELLDVSLPSITSFGEGGSGELFATNGSEVHRIVSTVLFSDGFESGNVSAWSSSVP
ncbi:MAG: PQQ-dependent sugar dehydrogenase [Thermoanaerobaculia bacterium]|nr:PQQ-dependent sugar dehydrogenase [Thermoanaerobaculia bacterium]